MDQLFEKVFSEAGIVSAILCFVMLMIQREKLQLIEYYRNRDEHYLKIVISLNETLASVERKLRND